MKTVVITGAATGIGAATARLFAKNGWRVAAVFHRQPVEAVENVYPFYADVTDAQSVAEMIAQVRAALGSPDALVNNAGAAQAQDVATNLSEAAYERLFAVNMKSVYLCTNAVLPDFLREKKGSIVNVASIWGVYGASCEAAYSAAKAAVIGYTKSMAKELGPSGVRVNCVAPGLIETQMNAHLSAADKQAFAAQTALGRAGTPEEVAETIRFLTESAAYITGQTVCVDGGY